MIGEILVVGFLAAALIVLTAILYKLVFDFLLPMVFYGAIFARSSDVLVGRMVALAGEVAGRRVVDIGSGDGRLVIAMAKAGAEAHGYEINPLLVLIARQNIRRAGLQGKAHVHWANFWQKDFSNFDVVTIYGISYIMKNLEAKLQQELKPGAIVISNYFAFPVWPPVSSQSSIFFYLRK